MLYNILYDSFDINFFFIIFNHTVIIQCCTGKILHYWISFIARFCNIHACVCGVFVYFYQSSSYWVYKLVSATTHLLAATTTDLELTCWRQPRLSSRWHACGDRDYCPCADTLVSAVTTAFALMTCSRRPRLPSADILSRWSRLPLLWHTHGGHDYPYGDTLATATTFLTLACSRRSRLPSHWLTRWRRPRLPSR